MNFDAHAFISYAHIDNAALVEGQAGWVANLERALRIRLAQRLGKESRIWRDDKLKGNEYFDETLIERLRRVAALVAVLSPRYVKSDWGRKEIEAFCDAAEAQGGVRVRDKTRLFKVLKTAVPLELHPPELRDMLGYEFFKVDPATGKVRDLDEVFGSEAQRDFWLKLDDLGLRHVHSHRGARGRACRRGRDGQPGARSTSPSRRRISRSSATRSNAISNSTATGCCPTGRCRTRRADVDAFVSEALSQCRMSIHLVGRTYSLVPEGGQQSIIEVQNELAIIRAAAGSFSRLVWIPPGLRIADDRQRRVVEAIRVDPRITDTADVLETPLTDLRTQIAAWLEDDEPAAPTAVTASVARAKGVYLIYDKRDADRVGPWADYLFKETQLEIVRSLFDGDEAEVRAYHEESLRHCDAALIFHGAGGELWLQRKLREVRKSAGYGRTTPPPVVGICLIGPRTPEKEQFRTHDGLLLPQWDGLAPEALQPFVSALLEPAKGA